ncbi:MAG: hypothetical protein LBJ64_03220 [Deltaproteobacteria bacterium]|nr:hypothetical protein [Deltaproteobacteria bacterium]
MDKVPEIFLKNHEETIFVLNDEQSLCGIITKDDFFRKAFSAKRIVDLMDKDFLRINISNIDNPYDVNASADKIFNDNPSLKTIPAVNCNGELCFTIDKGRDYKYKYKFLRYKNNDIIDILNFRDNKNEMFEFLNSLGIKTIAVIKEDRVVEYFGGLLSQSFAVDFFENVETFESSVKHGSQFDLVLLQDSFFSPQGIKLTLKGMFVQDFRHLFSARESVTDILSNLKKLSKICDSVFLFKVPTFDKVKNPSVAELGLADKTKDYDVMLSGLNVYGKDREEYLAGVDYVPPAMKKNGDIVLLDCDKKYCHVINGRRLTTDKVREYQQKLFVLGNSLAFGFGNEDRHTIQSFLQRAVNNSEKSYDVVNCGVPWSVSLHNVLEEAVGGDKIILIMGGHQADIVIDLMQKENIDNVHVHCLSHLFDRPHDLGAVFSDQYHVNHVGNKAIAEEILKAISEKDEVGLVKEHISDLLSRSQKDDSELMALGLQDYLDELAKHKRSGDIIGAICMNCDPFTSGHKHLVEHAASEVDHLFVFVTDVEKTFFKADERLYMAKSATANLKNVTVLQTGRFIASLITFPMYFNKENVNSGEIDFSLDAGIFARHIAPALNITKRFLGEEPYCYLTSQYNKALGEIFPKHGIELSIIPRKEADGAPISASAVRSLIQKGDFDRIKRIVPATTFEHISKTCGR